MSRVTDKQYCQSCGMPLRFDVEEYLGTNADYTLSDEYCYYCLKDGKYTVDIPLEQMVDIWVKYTDKYNWYSGTSYTPKELRTLLNKRLPTLKRWQQKAETEYIHYEAISRIKNHIDHNLFAELDPEQLAIMASLSFFHFRRIFKSITGENIGTYIQRLRLEYIAHLLIATNQPIEQIQKQTSYQTKSSLAKAFKKHFGISMSEYRKKYASAGSQSQQNILLEAEIRRINTQKVICLEVGNTFRNEEAYKAIWTQLTHFQKKHQQEASKNYFVSISCDNPFVTPIDQRRFYIGVTADKDVKSEGKLTIQEISGGMYAVFRHRGSYAELPDLYRLIYEEWLPQSKYVQKYPLTFESYLNTPNELAIDDLITEIYIPIEKQ